MKTDVKRKSIADALFETNYQTNLSSELWLNIAGKDYRLVGKAIKIGRALDNDIVLEDKSSSRYHALLSVNGTRVILEDLKSRNGIRVNGKRLRRMELQNNDSVEIGDLPGTFFHRQRMGTRNQKKSAKEQTQSRSVKIDAIGETPKESFSDRLKNLSPKQKLGLVACTPLVLFSFLLFLGGPTQQVQLSNKSQSQVGSLNKKDIVDIEADKNTFDRCLEFEDLGNFKQSRKCFQNLPLNKEVFSALSRVMKRQEGLTQLRYQEGARAFENYYYDLAIIKWQEVLLIADEDAEQLHQATEGIQSAMKMKSLL